MRSRNGSDVAPAASVETHLNLAVASLSVPPFALFAWALRGHFRHDRRPSRGMLLLSLASLAAYAHFAAGCLRPPGPAPRLAQALEASCFLAGFLLFLWAVRATRLGRLRLAHSATGPDSLHVDGPYRFVRHPFYLSYILFWIGTAIGAGASQWLAAACLTAWYATLARAEERRFAAGPLAAEYDLYRRRAGMFVPTLAALGGPRAPTLRSSTGDETPARGSMTQSTTPAPVESG